jgi:hypothetical protein
MDAGSSDVVATERSKHRRNWWKVGFFVALLAFEFTRELLVVTEAQGAIPNASAQVFSYDGFVKVEGSWKRIDGGGSLVPGTVVIECRRESGQCLEASTMIHDEYVYAPDLSYFNATFTPDSVSYVNDVPDCAKYSVRIDLEMKKAFAVRQKKAQATNPACAALENRIEMQIADGYETHTAEHDPFKGHFVPILSLLKAIFD